MALNNKEKIRNFFKNHYGLIIISLIGLITLIIPFIADNNLENFDAAGQYANAYYIKNVFWPWPGGWNSQLLSGFPQGLFYPPLFHYLSAALSFIIPLALAYKLLLGLAIFIFPIIFFLLAKNIFKNTLQATAALTATGIFYYFDMGLNDNLFCDLYFGMSPHLFSLTIFVVYLLFISKLINEPKKWWRTASLFLATLIVTHSFTSIMAIIFSLIIIILNWDDRFLKINLIKHFGLAFLLSAWWWLPAILNIGYVSGSDINGQSAPVLTVMMPFILTSSIIALKIKEKNLFISSISIFNLSILAVYLFSNFFSIDYFPVHFTRFLVYPVLLAPLTFIYLLARKTINWQIINLSLLFAFIFYIFFFRIIPIGPFNTKLLENIEHYWQSGRIIVSGGTRNLDDRFHITRMKLAVEQGLPAAEGLFVESTPNGWFIMSMMKSWENTAPTFVWAYNNLQSVCDLSWGTKIFGINYEYRLNDLRPTEEENNFLEQREKNNSRKNISGLIEDAKIGEKKKEDNYLNFKINRIRLLDNERVISMLANENSPFYYQSFYQVASTSIAEALNLRPINITHNWTNNITKWWTTDWLKVENKKSYNKPVLIFQTNTDNWQTADENFNLPFTELGEKMNNFLVDASVLEKPAPIYVKVGYFPFWHAYNESGQEIKIYKASPNFMLVYGQGRINFKYIHPWYYYFGFIVSGFSFLLLLIFWLFFNKKTKYINS